MSRRGVNFLHKWMVEQMPNAFTNDPAAITDLADQAMKAAGKEGISSDEINEEVGSVFEVIHCAMRIRASGEWP